MGGGGGEAATPQTTAAASTKLGHPSSSFRLRSPSLNAVRLRRVFDIFDRNGDGEITVDELGHALELLGLEADIAELSSTVQTYIRPGHAGLEFGDFQDLHRSLGDALFGDVGSAGEEEEVVVEEDLSEAFKVFDVDGDGFISARELKEVLGKLGFVEGNGIQNVGDMIGAFDRNADGRVDFGEFKYMMRSFSIKNACA